MYTISSRIMHSHNVAVSNLSPRGDELDTATFRLCSDARQCTKFRFSLPGRSVEIMYIRFPVILHLSEIVSSGMFFHSVPSPPIISLLWHTSPNQSTHTVAPTHGASHKLRAMHAILHVRNFNRTPRGVLLKFCTCPAAGSGLRFPDLRI